MIRGLYRLLLSLHPSSFRERFEDEMLLTFEDAVVAEGSFRLVMDGLRSLARQWLVRQAFWIYPAAVAGATLVIALIGWTRTAVMARTTPPDASDALLLLIAVMAVMAVLFTTIFCVVWLRLIQRLRHA